VQVPHLASRELLAFSLSAPTASVQGWRARCFAQGARHLSGAADVAMPGITRVDYRRQILWTNLIALKRTKEPRPVHGGRPGFARRRIVCSGRFAGEASAASSAALRRQAVESS